MAASRLNIYSIGLNSEWCNKEANLTLVEEYLQQMPANTDLVLLPELFSTGMVTDEYDLIQDNCERNTGETISRLREYGRKYNVAFSGSFMATTGTKIYNRAFFIEPNGNEYFYDKRHLFGSENKHYTAGKALPPIIRYRGCNIMPVVCYDLRFPCWCFNQNIKYDILLVVASWPKVREYAWRQLLIARAIENQAYVCGVNRSGIGINGLEYPAKSSTTINYKGESIEQPVTGNAVWASVDLEDLCNAREKFPVWKDACDNDIIMNNCNYE